MFSTSFRMMRPDMQSGLSAEADYERDVLTVGRDEGKPEEFCLSHLRNCLDKRYHVEKPEGGWKKDFTDEEKRKLRPIAETLAMLDGNAFFTVDVGKDREWYESYLPEAHAVYESNGGDSGWAGEASFAKASEIPG